MPSSPAWPTSKALASSAARVVHVNTEPFDLYIGRTFAGHISTGWQNPVGGATHSPAARAAAVVAFFEYLQSDKVIPTSLRKQIRAGELSGKILGCWCKTTPWENSPCHGIILAGLADGLVEEVKSYITALSDFANASLPAHTALVGTDPILAVDGNNLIHRAYHASHGRDPLSMALSMLSQAIELARPTSIVVAMDSPVSLRRQKDETYKATRSEKDQDLVTALVQFPVLAADLGLLVHEEEGLEADDILASIAAIATPATPVVMFTSDRDCFSHISPCVLALRPGKDAPEFYTEKEVLAKYGVAPDRYLELSALRGDPSDNLPGVRGIGVKTAATLLASHSLTDLMNGTNGAADTKAGKKVSDAAREVAHSLDMMSPYIIDAAPLIPKATLDAALSSSNADKALDQGRISPRAHTTFTDALT